VTASAVAVVIVICTSTCAVAGCGGDSQSDATPAVGDAFAKRAAAVCQKALKSKQAWRPFPVSGFDPAHPTPSALPKVALWLKHEVAPTFDAWLSGLRSLGQPETGGQGWSDTIKAVARIDKGNVDQITAAERGDTDAFIAATNDLRTTQKSLERATAATGVPTCADVHKG
jgi:hypothetical protein